MFSFVILTLATIKHLFLPEKSYELHFDPLQHFLVSFSFIKPGDTSEQGCLNRHLKLVSVNSEKKKLREAIKRILAGILKEGGLENVLIKDF